MFTQQLVISQVLKVASQHQQWQSTQKTEKCASAHDRSSGSSSECAAIYHRGGGSSSL
jgi:hypothetical protein